MSPIKDMEGQVFPNEFPDHRVLQNGVPVIRVTYPEDSVSRHPAGNSDACIQNGVVIGGEKDRLRAVANKEIQEFDGAPVTSRRSMRQLVNAALVFAVLLSLGCDA